MNVINKILLSCFCLLFINVKAMAEPDGTCWSVPLVSFIITLSAGNFNDSKAGTTATFDFGNMSAPYYPMACAPNPDHLQLNYNKGDFGPGLDSTGTTLHLTKDVDVVIQPAVAASNNTIPFINSVNENGVTPPSQGTDGTTGFDGHLGVSGTMKFTLRRDVIGGALIIPPGIVMFTTYRSVYRDVYASQPVTLGITGGQIIPVKQNCTINGGNQITIPFGDIQGEALKSDGPSSIIQKSQDLAFQCTSSLTQDIAITLVAAPSAFDSKAIMSSLQDIGVVMMHDGKVVDPNTSFDSKLVDGKGSDTVTFAPIINKESTATVQGSFTASATLVMTSA